MSPNDPGWGGSLPEDGNAGTNRREGTPRGSRSANPLPLKGLPKPLGTRVCTHAPALSLFLLPTPPCPPPDGSPHSTCLNKPSPPSCHPLQASPRSPAFAAPPLCPPWQPGQAGREGLPPEQLAFSHAHCHVGDSQRTWALWFLPRDLTLQSWASVSQSYPHSLTHQEMYPRRALRKELSSQHTGGAGWGGRAARIERCVHGSPGGPYIHQFSFQHPGP